MTLFRIYAWVAMIGFPIIAMRWLAYEKKICKNSWGTGYDDGQQVGIKFTIRYLKDAPCILSCCQRCSESAAKWLETELLDEETTKED